MLSPNEFLTFNKQYKNLKYLKFVIMARSNTGMFYSIQFIHDPNEVTAYAQVTQLYQG